MAADIAAILADIESCFDFTGRSVLHVGAGGGQFVGYAAKAACVLAVDPEPAAVERLRTALRERGLEGRVAVRQGDLMDVGECADIVFFEFCLHEIADPRAALRHARTLAPRILVADHAPGSDWCDLMLEGDKVRASWSAVEAFPRALDRRFAAEQRFRDHPELVAKIAVLGDEVIDRAGAHVGRQDFVIPMPYRIALLEG